MEEIDEDTILAGLSAEELQQLQNDMDDIAPNTTVPLGKRQNNASDEATTQGFLFLVTFCLFCSFFSIDCNNVIIITLFTLNKFILLIS